MRVYLPIAALLISMSIVASTDASVLTSRLTFDGPIHHTLLFGSPFQGGGEDKLQDDSVTALVDNGDGVIGIGDFVYGIINMTNTQASTQANQGISQTEQITIVFSAKFTGAGSGGSFSLGPVADSLSDIDLRNLLSPSIIDDFSLGAFDDTSVFVVMSNPIGTAEVGGINPLNSNANIGGAVDANSIENVLTNANGWTGDAIGGLLAGNFFEFLSTGGLSGLERGGFTITEKNFSGFFLSVDVANFGGVITDHDVTLDFGSVNAASVEEQGKGWVFSDQGSFFVNVKAVPEPATAVVWSILLGFATICSRRPQRLAA